MAYEERAQCLMWVVNAGEASNVVWRSLRLVCR